MRVKVFAAATMQEAMAKVKGELGLDAVILHTKRFHKGGFLGYMGKEVVEVTAAVDDAPKLSTARPAAKKPLLPKNIAQAYAAGSGAGAKDAKETKETKEPAREAEKPAQETKAAQAAPASDAAAGILRRAAEVEAEADADAEADARFSATADGGLEERQADEIMRLQRELDGMKLMLEKVMNEKSGGEAAAKSLIDTLRAHEVQDAVAQEIIAEIFDEDILMNRDAAKTAEVLARYFTQMFRPPQEISVAENRCKVVALIGSTGVGKTTTAAKLAANFVLHRGCGVALITADTYRISAVEQLKTYSDILGVPLEIVYSPVELKAAINKHRDKQLVLIDTAGRSQHNEFQMNELQELLAADSAIEKHLVLSATTKYRDAVDILRNFSVCAPHSLLFTKIDETASVGLIINLMHQYPVLLSYFTNGQSVPDDICVADGRKLAELILR